MICYGSQVSGGTEWVTVTRKNVTACPLGEYVAVSQLEYDQWMQAGVSPFEVSVAEAGPICGAILMLWALAFGIRWAIRALRNTDSASFTDGD